ncbi:universal stress protein UspA-like protein [Synechococcus sp. PCC 7502]|uniref:universal stress protein n=1 Tax=Synechococcus sp. PCC 7502 TaxID=1173263 RepID=UPI00029FBDF4|nr:universal stress protein [Synechococcus sp. PCC 7502]AFY72743.1 universal stress protein UspA-like protein [Synechococcus sp. PCC 7502]
MFESILLTVDGSGRSREMMNMLLQLPSMQRTQITILHVIPMQATVEGVTEYRLAGEKILEKERAELKLGVNNSSVAILKEGDAKDIVCQIADQLKPNLLIMGSRGMGRLQSILNNSVSTYVFQLASVPMLLVKDDVYIKSIRNVMVALDGSPSGQHALDQAIAIISGLKDAAIYLTRVSKKKDDSDPVVDKAIEKLKRLNIPYKLFLGTGETGKEICKAADESNTSLLVLGSPDRRPSIAKGIPDLDRLLGTSVSDYVRVNAPCPLILTRLQES